MIIVAWRYGYVPDDRLLKSNSPKRQTGTAFLLDPEAPWLPNRVDAMSGAPGSGEDVSGCALVGLVRYDRNPCSYPTASFARR